MKTRTTQATASKRYCMSLVAAWALLAPCANTHAQGTMTITFDGEPEQPPGTQYAFSTYHENGITFTPHRPGARGFARAGAALDGMPDNGTAYLQMDWEGIAFSFDDGSEFGLLSLDMADYAVDEIEGEGYSLEIVGYRPDGSTLTNAWSGSGIMFQTQQLGSEWASGLVRVGMYSWLGSSIDNLVLAVPEPGSMALFVSGLAGLLLARRRRL